MLAQLEKNTVGNSVKHSIELMTSWGFPGGTVVKNLPVNVGDLRDVGSWRTVWRFFKKLEIDLGILNFVLENDSQAPKWH